MTPEQEWRVICITTVIFVVGDIVLLLYATLGLAGMLTPGGW